MRACSFILAALLSAMTARAEQPPTGYEGTETAPSLLGKLDLSCMLRTWRIIGVMTCPTPAGGVRTCMIVENAYPVGILEAVRRPLASHLAEVNSFTKSLQGIRPFGMTSSHTTDAASGTALQFSEAHVFESVPELALSAALPLARPRGRTFQVSYLSELDGWFWRTGLAEMLLDPAAAVKKAALPSCSVVPRVGDCAWSWGSWSPRIGFTAHPSEVMAGQLLALRAGRVASQPMGRVVETAYPFEPRTGHMLQMVRPRWRRAVRIGAAGPIDEGVGSFNGAYLFIHLGIFEECRRCLPLRLVGPR